MKRPFTRTEDFYRLLLAMISQDVKIPLANALYMLKLNSRRKDDKNSSEEMRQFLQALEKHLAEAHSLFSELLGWSRTYFIPASADSGSVHLTALTEDIIQYVSETQPAVLINNIPPDMQLPGSYTEVYRFVVRNLILNCSKFSRSAKNNIIIAAQIKDRRYEVSVSTNSKLPAELIKKVLHSTGRIPREAAGTDWLLSLLLCRHCLAELDAGLWLDDKKEAFYFTLPSA